MQARTARADVSALRGCRTADAGRAHRRGDDGRPAEDGLGARAPGRRPGPPRTPIRRSARACSAPAALASRRWLDAALGGARAYRRAASRRRCARVDAGASRTASSAPSCARLGPAEAEALGVSSRRGAAGGTEVRLAHRDRAWPRRVARLATPATGEAGGGRRSRRAGSARRAGSSAARGARPGQPAREGGVRGREGAARRARGAARGPRAQPRRAREAPATSWRRPSSGASTRPSTPSRGTSKRSPRRSSPAARAACRLEAATRTSGKTSPGIEVELRPAGKRITRLSLLSGGEKALGAISFLFALFLARPCPFYLLDEVEAALDDANIGRFVELLRRYADRAQFVVDHAPEADDGGGRRPLRRHDGRRRHLADRLAAPAPRSEERAVAAQSTRDTGPRRAVPGPGPDHRDTFRRCRRTLQSIPWRGRRSSGDAEAATTQGPGSSVACATRWRPAARSPNSLPPRRSTPPTTRPGSGSRRRSSPPTCRRACDRRARAAARGGAAELARPRARRWPRRSPLLLGDRRRSKSNERPARDPRRRRERHRQDDDDRQARGQARGARPLRRRRRRRHLPRRRRGAARDLGRARGRGLRRLRARRRPRRPSPTTRSRRRRRAGATSSSSTPPAGSTRRRT